MARINLLPWRDELRKEKQRQFISVLGLVLALGVVVVFSYNYTVSLQIESQQDRNRFLTQEIASLDSQIKEIEKLEDERQRLIERMEMIASLQKSRPKVVKMFDEIVRAIPEGLNLSSIIRKGSELTVNGAAESAPRVSSLMRNIDSSNTLRNKRLDRIDSDQELGGGRKTFSLILTESDSGDDAESEGES